MTFLHVEPSSYTQQGPSPGMIRSPTTLADGLTVFAVSRPLEPRSERGLRDAS